MARKKVSFIATKYKNKKAKINFYTKDGKKISFDAVKRTPAKEKIEFYVRDKRKE